MGPWSGAATAASVGALVVIAEVGVIAAFPAASGSLVPGVVPVVVVAAVLLASTDALLTPVALSVVLRSACGVLDLPVDVLVALVTDALALVEAVPVVADDVAGDAA